jgi:hypothetical protein
VQDVLKEHDKFRQRTQHHKYLLCGLLYSNDAKSGYWSETHTKKGMSYYRSKTKLNGQHVFYNTRDIDVQLPELFKKITITKEASSSGKTSMPGLRTN